MRCHDSSHVVALHQEFVLVLSALLVNVNDGSCDLGYSLDHHLSGKKKKKQLNVQTPVMILYRKVMFTGLCFQPKTQTTASSHLSMARCTDQYFGIKKMKSMVLQRVHNLT